MTPAIDQNSSSSLKCTKYYLESVGQCDCSFRSLVAKITLVALPIFLLIALIMDLIRLLVHCATTKKSAVINPMPQEDNANIAFRLRAMKQGVLPANDFDQLKKRYADSYAIESQI